MITTHPSIMLGSYVLDEDRLPRDEFDIRLAPLREAMTREGHAATLIYGDAKEHEALAFFTNFIPRMRWAMAMIPAKGEPRLLISISSRDMPAMKAMTWIADVKSGWEWKWFEDHVAKLPAPGILATINLDMMTPLLFGQLSKSIDGVFTLAEADHVASKAREKHRPREIAMIRAAAKIGDAAGNAIAERWRAGDDVENAALAGERLARAMAAQDVRTLVSRDGGLTLEPYRARFDDRPKALLAYVAVKYMGYWAEAFISLGGPAQKANTALDDMLKRFKPGAPIAASAHPALGGSAGHRIGLSLVEGPELRAGAEALVAGVVYALRAGETDTGAGAVASAMVLRRGDGSFEILSRSVCA